MTWTGHELQDLRMDLRVSVDQFARLLGVSRVTIYRWFNAGADQAHVTGGAVRIIELAQGHVEIPRTREQAGELAEELRAAIDADDTGAIFRVLTAQLQMQKPA